MKFGFFLSAGLVALLTASHAEAKATMEDATSLTLSFDEFKRLNEADRQSYLETLRTFAVEAEARGGFARLSPEAPRLWRLWLDEAVAEPGQPCIFAGYISKFNSRDKCERPSAISGRTWTLTTPAGQKVQQKLCSSPGQTLCNPMLYGFGRFDGGGFSGICTSSATNPTSDCEKQYRALPNYPASAVTAQLLTSGIEKDFNDLAGQVSDYCAGVGKDRQKGPCASMTSRVNYLKNRLAGGDRRSQDALLKRISPGAETAAATPALTDTRPSAKTTRTAAVPESRPETQATTAGAEQQPAQTEQRRSDAGKKPEDCNCSTADSAGATRPLTDLGRTMADAQKAICQPDPKIEPQPGQAVTVGTVVFGITDGSSQTGALMRKAQALIEKAKDNTKGCPDGCKRDNETPKITVDTQPTKPDKSAGCPRQDYQALGGFSAADLAGERGVTFSSSDKALMKTFSGGNCEKDLKDWTQATLVGGLFGCSTALCKNIDEVKCPSPCSLSNTLVVEDVSSGSSCKLNVRLIVKCGPNKGQREWKATARITQDWSCKPQGGRQ